MMMRVRGSKSDHLEKSLIVIEGNCVGRPKNRPGSRRAGLKARLCKPSTECSGSRLRRPELLFKSGSINLYGNQESGSESMPQQPEILAKQTALWTLQRPWEFWELKSTDCEIAFFSDLLQLQWCLTTLMGNTTAERSVELCERLGWGRCWPLITSGTSPQKRQSKLKTCINVLPSESWTWSDRMVDYTLNLVCVGCADRS